MTGRMTVGWRAAGHAGATGHLVAAHPLATEPSNRARIELHASGRYPPMSDQVHAFSGRIKQCYY